VKDTGGCMSKLKILRKSTIIWAHLNIYSFLISIAIDKENWLSFSKNSARGGFRPMDPMGKQFLPQWKKK
jgi:hypothetical protein